MLGQETNTVGRAFRVTQNSPRIRDWRDAHICFCGLQQNTGTFLRQTTSGNSRPPDGDANAEETLSRIAQFKVLERISGSDV
jgi:hypothetical protein